MRWAVPPGTGTFQAGVLIQTPPTDPPVTSGKSRSGTRDHDLDVLSGPFMGAVT